MASEYKTHIAKRPNNKLGVGEPIHKMRMLDQNVTTDFSKVTCSVCLGWIDKIARADNDRNRWIFKHEIKDATPAAEIAGENKTMKLQLDDEHKLNFILNSLSEKLGSLDYLGQYAATIGDKSETTDAALIIEAIDRAKIEIEHARTLAKNAVDRFYAGVVTDAAAAAEYVAGMREAEGPTENATIAPHYIDMRELDKLDLTSGEALFVQVFVDSLYAEPGFSDVDVKDIAEGMSAIRVNNPVSIASAKGILGSLVKKGIVWTDEMTGGNGKKYELIYLQSEYYSLHKIWAAECAAEIREAEGSTETPAEPEPINENIAYRGRVVAKEGRLLIGGVKATESTLFWKRSDAAAWIETKEALDGERIGLTRVISVNLAGTGIDRSGIL